ncbi:hypothetical protein ACFWN2_10505 [Lentzea sp. NPDC058436]|uniref:hypothetical protein n=1 Tax=Lentzea sp. NPDC058436 TaxID=3346499 RepID=UPI003666E450
MVVFECVACGAALTVPLTQVDTPDHARVHQWGNGVLEMPGLVPPGTYAGHVIAPGDVRGVSWIKGRLVGYCCGIDGHEGPNLACGCGRPVATRVDDCSLWQVVRFEPDAVRAVGDPDPVRPWETFDWDSVPLTDADRWWQARAEISAAVALVRVLAVAADASVVVPDGPLADTFQAGLTERGSQGPRTLTLGLAGPGETSGADVLLVPRHPQTGDAWPVPGRVVPISAELWTWLARADEQPVRPRTGGQWAPHLDDDPLPRRPRAVKPCEWTVRDMSKRP